MAFFKCNEGDAGAKTGYGTAYIIATGDGVKTEINVKGILPRRDDNAYRFAVTVYPSSASGSGSDNQPINATWMNASGGFSVPRITYNNNTETVSMSSTSVSGNIYATAGGANGGMTVSKSYSSPIACVIAYVEK
ncbi:MAG: hypothetical protein NC409_12370 [Clostridium sp.]|nr:hypothetical protein [Clostridium sp.]